MMSELIERFRYRFQLWRREERDDYFGASTAPPEEEDYVSYYTARNRVVLLKESAVRLVGRSVQAYFGIIIIVSWICWVLGRFIPSIRFGLGVGFLVFVGIWTLATILGTVRLSKARKQYRAQANKTSNQSLQPTASRRATQFSRD
jgi:uncharacterized membrane protein (DUF485 family)